MSIGEYDIGSIRDRLNWNPELNDIRLRALYVLEEFIGLVNNCSDGWAYWQPPGKAAKKLCELIESGKDVMHGEATAVTVADFKKALRPIKACLTRYNDGFNRSLLYDPFMEILNAAGK